MYAFIMGVVHRVSVDNVIINNNGIGYRVFMAKAEELKKNQEVFLYTYQHVREDALLLYGFLREQEYDVFLELIKVKGVGCRTAMGMLSGCRIEEMIVAIEASDVAFMKRLPGIGPKTAQQIILDLRGKLVQDVGEVKVSMLPLFQEVEQAMKSLGYKSNEINPILKQLPIDPSIQIDVLIKLALGLMLKSKGG